MWRDRAWPCAARRGSVRSGASRLGTARRGSARYVKARIFTFRSSVNGLFNIGSR